LIHPDVIEPKLGFERQFVSAVRGFSWFGTMNDFGRFWEARNAVQVASEWQGGKLVVRLDAPTPIEGLTLTPPSGLHPVSGQPLVREAREQSVVLGKVAGSATVEFTR
jgi:hypothetical protein